MNTLDYIVNKYKLDLERKLPINIPNVGRNSLPEWFHELDFKVGVEIGVAEGEYSEIICKANPQMKIYGVDPYEPYIAYMGGSYMGVLDYMLVHEAKDYYQQAQERLKHFPKYSLIREFSMKALKKFEDNSLDFVYIDANHSDPYVTQDIEGWSKKVKTGGIVSGHDYIEGGHSRVKKGKIRLFGRYYKYILQEEPYSEWHVKETVHTYTRENNIKPWFLLDFEYTIPGMIADNNPSWMWIKQ